MTSLPGLQTGAQSNCGTDTTGRLTAAGGDLSVSSTILIAQRDIINNNNNNHIRHYLFNVGRRLLIYQELLLPYTLHAALHAVATFNACLRLSHEPCVSPPRLALILISHKLDPCLEQRTAADRLPRFLDLKPLAQQESCATVDNATIPGYVCEQRLGERIESSLNCLTAGTKPIPNVDDIHKT